MCPAPANERSTPPSHETALDARERVILALDVDDREDAMRLVEATQPDLRYVKVGWQLFLGGGTALVEELAGAGLKVFLDLKVGDVDNTVTMAIRRLSTLPVELLTLNGNSATVAAAVAGRGEGRAPELLLVTLLSSWNADDLGGTARDGAAFDVDDYVAQRAVATLDSGGDGVIASGSSVGRVRERLGGRPCQIVTPGVRPADVTSDEHKRALTPAEAIKLGADRLVVGRPITQSSVPYDALRQIVDEIVAAS